MLVFIPIAYLLAYHSLPLFNFVRTRTKPLVRRGERFGVKVGVLRFLIYFGCSLPIYYLNFAALAFTEWAGGDGAGVGGGWAGYYSQVIGVLGGVWVSVFGSGWIFVKVGCAVKSDFPEAQWVEEKKGVAKGGSLRSADRRTKELGGF